MLARRTALSALPKPTAQTANLHTASRLSALSTLAPPAQTNNFKLSAHYSTTSILSAGVGTKPTIDEAKACPREFHEMTNDMIIKLSAENVFEAIEERLIRDIMAVNDCDWDAAHTE
jgi:hypothetical protein